MRIVVRACFCRIQNLSICNYGFRTLARVLQNVCVFERKQKIPWVRTGEIANYLKTFAVALSPPKKEGEDDFRVHTGFAAGLAGFLQQFDPGLLVPAQSGDMGEHPHRPWQTPGDILVSTDDGLRVAEVGV